GGPRTRGARRRPAARRLGAGAARRRAVDRRQRRHARLTAPAAARARPRHGTAASATVRPPRRNPVPSPPNKSPMIAIPSPVPADPSRKLALALAAAAALLAGCATPDAAARPARPAAGAHPPFVLRAGRPVEPIDGEVRLRNVRQLTFGGENAEAYWSFDGTKLIFQSRRPPEVPADQIYTLDLATGEERMVSTGKGRTTCAYFLKGDREIVFASTHLAENEPPPPVRTIAGKYVWPIFETYEIFKAKVDGSGLTRLTDVPGYDAEATVDPVSGRIVFTSMRDGELELYTMAPDGGDVRRVTNRVGYDGGAFFSPDGTQLVLRSGFPADEEE